MLFVLSQVVVFILSDPHNIKFSDIYVIMQYVKMDDNILCDLDFKVTDVLILLSLGAMRRHGMHTEYWMDGWMGGWMDGWMEGL